MLNFRHLLLSALVCFGVTATAAPVRSEILDSTSFQRWIEAMKSSSRGPFSRIRWFCKDSSVLPPKPYACRGHGGGFQHGEWTVHTKLLRSLGYKIANVLAELDIDAIVSQPGYSDTLNQILIEQFLISIDDGWILRKARYYRGALQSEDETRAARRLLIGLAGNKHWITRGYMPLRMAVRLLPHSVASPSVVKVRQQALTLSEKDNGFMSIRYKIHVKPDRGDAKLVRDYATALNNPKVAEEYLRLADDIEQVYASESALKKFQMLYGRLATQRELRKILSAETKQLLAHQDPGVRFAMTGELLAKLRDQLSHLRRASLRLDVIELSLALEDEHFAAATALMQQRSSATRRQHLRWLEDSVNASYGAGLLSRRELHALKQNFTRLQSNSIPRDVYKAGLDYLALVPGWGNRWFRHHFSRSVKKLTAIEPLVSRFIQEQLRSGPLFHYATLMEGLFRDVNYLTGVRHVLFNQEVGTGLRALNPGLARGVLSTKSNHNQENFEPDGIYVLPETTAELPPVAGILTAGEGNPLSHIQLLARNLGIPNVGVDQALLPRLESFDGQRVILAVSPAGTVQLREDHGQLNALFAKEGAKAGILIRPDLNKLDLQFRDLMPLSALRAADSGRFVGPKAAKLGELQHYYPEFVVSGLTIPFGVFRNMLNRPLGNGKQTVFEWMVEQYASLQSMKPGSQQRRAVTDSFLKQLRAWILNADPGNAFKQQLRIAMEEMFGKDGTYGVFVRSDTNVEDLPGFTGAGLNKTVANVVGYENVLKAISEVWASPFTKRAFAWRQAHMDQPQHVYPAVLIMRSVPVEKSGVLVTRDIETGAADWLSVAVNEGVGGAVDGQSAESLRISMKTGEVRLLAQATAPWRRMLKRTGGIGQYAVSGRDAVLKPEELVTLVEFARDLPNRFPAFRDAVGNAVPADIEFGFVRGNLRLFQIRPFLESETARSNEYLNSLDRDRSQRLDRMVKMNDRPQIGA